MTEPPTGPWWMWVIVLASFVYQFWMIRDMLNREDTEIRGGRVGPWFFAVVFGGPFGALMYQLGGRKSLESSTSQEETADQD